MKKIINTIVFCCVFLFVNAQFPVGHTTIVFNDASRDRNISCELYYPATTSGEDVVVAEGNFPVLIFGHGFAMNFNNYSSLRAAIIPQGYVLAFVATVGGFAPDHEQVGMDYAFVAGEMLAENTNTQSLFFGKLNNRTGMMGHSMGGGCSWLAASGNPDIDCLIGLAPAETTTSAISAASGVTAPVLVFSGSSDGVTPPADNHIPIFENSQSECKVFVNIAEGSHCGYADNQTLCDFGELTFNGLSRESQQAAVFPIILYWLNYHLRDEVSQFNEMLIFDEQNNDIEASVECVLNTTERSFGDEMLVYPNPVSDVLCYLADSRDGLYQSYSIEDLQGKTISTGTCNKNNGVISTRALSTGVYFVRFYSGNQSSVRRFVKI